MCRSPNRHAFRIGGSSFTFAPTNRPSDNTSLKRKSGLSFNNKYFPRFFSIWESAICSSTSFFEASFFTLSLSGFPTVTAFADVENACPLCTYSRNHKIRIQKTFLERQQKKGSSLPLDQPCETTNFFNGKNVRSSIFTLIELRGWHSSWESFLGFSSFTLTMSCLPTGGVATYIYSRLLGSKRSQ